MAATIGPQTVVAIGGLESANDLGHATISGSHNTKSIKLMIIIILKTLPLPQGH